MKEVNRYTSSEFHDWQRRKLTPGLIIQDLDAWAILHSHPDTYEPLSLIELKRSSFAVTDWNPFPADRRNYMSLLAFAARASVPLYVVYFVKGREILPETEFAVFLLDPDAPGLVRSKQIMTSDEYARRHPHPIPV